MRAWRRGWHLVSPTLYIIIVYRVNLNKLSRNVVGALRTTTTNCRVSFIDLYLVFPRNFRILFLPHTNTVILLESYCGTITERGSPVLHIDIAPLRSTLSGILHSKNWTMILSVSGAHDSVSINIHSFFVPDQDTARYSICSAQEKCVSLTEPYTTHS